jgi:hypothetical protein
MRTVNLQKRQVLFLALLLSLGVSKSWLTSATHGETDLAQSAPEPFRVSVTARAELTGETPKTATEEISITVNARTERVATGINANGEVQREERRVTELHFSSPSCTGTCAMPPKVVTIAAGQTLGIDQIRVHATEALQARLLREMQAEVEARRHRGNLESRQRSAERCGIRIVDENDRRKDVRLRNAEKIECLTSRLQSETFVSDNAEFTRVKGALNAELRGMIFNRDQDIRDQAADVLGDLQGRFNNDRLEDYFYGMERGLDLVNSDIAAMYDSIEIIEEYGANSPQAISARTRIMAARPQYTFPRVHSPNRDENSGLEEIRKGMMEQLDSALRNPNQMLADNSDSVFSGDRSGGAGRVDNFDIRSFPRMDFNGGSSHRTGSVDPRMDPRFQTRPGSQVPPRVAYQQHPGDPRMQQPGSQYRVQGTYRGNTRGQRIPGQNY